MNKTPGAQKTAGKKVGLKLNDTSVITVNIKQGKDTSAGASRQVNHKGLPDEMLIKSVKLIIAHTGDTLNVKNSDLMDFSSDLDTSKFKKNFYNRVSANGMKFRISWSSGKMGNRPIKHAKALIVEPLPGFSLPYATITGYSGYLFRRITTQIIFGSILVFITALAFTVAYRSIRNHMILNSLRNEFVSNITHELKTPVSTIMVALEALGNYNMKKEPKVMEEYLRLASEETKRLGELINRVLDHTLLEQKEHPLDLIEIDLNRLITDVVSIMSRKTGSKGSIEFNRVDYNITLEGDLLYIKGVLINLIDNSIKYCDKDPVITVSAEKKSKDIVVEIKDNGPGIPEEYQKKIFEKFFRLPSENVHNVKGYGLGLSFASLVMELHKGSIAVKNLNPGCSFILKFPVL
jgi:signal transduction histidine kinase